MTIKIPVSAELNTESVRREIEQMRAALNSLGSVAAKAGGAKFQPIDELDIERVRRLKREFESLLRVSPGLRRRVAASGQQGVAFEQLDWERMIPDAGQRTKYARQVVGYMMPGSVAHAPVLPPASQQPRSAGVAATAGFQPLVRSHKPACGASAGPQAVSAASRRTRSAAACRWASVRGLPGCSAALVRWPSASWRARRWRIWARPRTTRSRSIA